MKCSKFLSTTAREEPKKIGQKTTKRIVEPKNELYLRKLVALRVEHASDLTGEEASIPTVGRSSVARPERSPAA
jgi:hypothetical protein